MDRTVEGPDVDIGIAGVEKNTCDPVAVAEREGSGRLGIGRGWGRRDIADGRHRQTGPVVLGRPAPADEDQPSVGLQRTLQIGEGRDRIVEEHHAEARDDPVEVAREVGQGGVGEAELHRPAALRCGKVQGAPDQGRRDVQPHDIPGRTHAGGHVEGRRPGPAADVQHMVAHGRGGGARQGRAIGRQHPVQPVLVLDPAPPVVAVPVQRRRDRRSAHVRAGSG